MFLLQVLPSFCVKFFWIFHSAGLISRIENVRLIHIIHTEIKLLSLHSLPIPFNYELLDGSCESTVSNALKSRHLYSKHACHNCRLASQQLLTCNAQKYFFYTDHAVTCETSSLPKS